MSRMRAGRPLLALAASVAGVLTACSCAATPAGPAVPAPVTILTARGGGHGADIFVAPIGQVSKYAYGPEILSSTGRVIWFHPVPAGQMATDFRTQTYLGEPVLTWWQGAGLAGLPGGTDYIYNDRYQQIATVHGVHGCQADGHEFLITPWNTALILCYITATANLRSLGGAADQTVINGIVQEIDIRTGRLLFQWDSAGHVPYSQSEQPLPAAPDVPWDWFHINAVHLAPDRNLLISGRNTWTAYDVSLRTGAIIWRLGGKDSSFTERAATGQVLDSAGKIFAWQHDPESVGHDTYTFFDNDSNGLALLPHSRAVIVRLNFRTKVATLVASYNQPEGLSAGAQGNVQTTAGGDLFVGWGVLPYFSEFSPAGKLLFNAGLPLGVHTYRAFLLPWKARAETAMTAFTAIFWQNGTSHYRRADHGS